MAAPHLLLVAFPWYNPFGGRAGALFNLSITISWPQQKRAPAGPPSKREVPARYYGVTKSGAVAKRAIEEQKEEYTVNGLRVAIEGELHPYAEALREAGFQVVPLDQTRLDQVAAVVVQGTDVRFLGMEEPATPAPVINADGMTAEQVVEAVRRRAVAPGH
ncbi:MAG: YkuS family protein [Firmicutes bacterium]|nr:YkuS family protein [Bacillota bacterium]